MTPTAGAPACIDPLTVTGRLPSDDTYLDADRPTTVYGSSTEIQVRSDQGYDRRGMIKFDLSDIPSGATLTSARLYLYQIVGQADQVTYIFRITQGWTEGTTTWNSPWINPGGDFDNTTAYGLFIPKQKNCYFSLDITNLAQLWVSGIYPNYGLMLYSIGQNHTVEYVSKDDTAFPERAPKLEITYEVSVNNNRSTPGNFLNLFAWIKAIFDA